jgi:hypothetical protein
MVAVPDRALRIRESCEKICSPFELDETLCLYRPQGNVECACASACSRLVPFVAERYDPQLPAGQTACPVAWLIRVCSAVNG